MSASEEDEQTLASKELLPGSGSEQGAGSEQGTGSEPGPGPEDEPGPGQRLQETRESQGLSQGDVARQLHLDIKMIVALEEDDYKHLPGSTYIVGYLRNYARVLNLPVDEVLAAYHTEQDDAPSLIPQNINYKTSLHGFEFATRHITRLLILFFIIMALVWWFMFYVDESIDELVSQITDHSVTQQPVVALKSNETPAPDLITAPIAVPIPDSKPMESSVGLLAETVVEVPAQESEPAAAQQDADEQPPAAKLLVLEFNSDSWTEVRDATGKKLVFSMISKGRTISLDGTPPFTIVLGYSPGVTINYKGKLFDHSIYNRDDIAHFNVGSSSDIAE